MNSDVLSNQSPGLVPGSWLQAYPCWSQNPLGTNWVVRVSLGSGLGRQIVSPLSAKGKTDMSVATTSV